MHQLCNKYGIISRFSCPYTFAQNGRAERKHRHVVETGLTLFAQASMSLAYWWDAFLVAVQIINGLPTPVLGGKSPIEVLFSKKTDFSSFRVFGSSCYPCLRQYISNISSCSHGEMCVPGIQSFSQRTQMP